MTRGKCRYPRGDVQEVLPRRQLKPEISKWCLVSSDFLQLLLTKVTDQESRSSGEVRQAKIRCSASACDSPGCASRFDGRQVSKVWPFRYNLLTEVGKKAFLQ